MEKFKREMTDFFDKLYPTEHKLLGIAEANSISSSSNTLESSALVMVPFLAPLYL